MHRATPPQSASARVLVVSAAWTATLVLAAASSCAPYHAGAINQKYRGSATSVGCLDIGAEALDDKKAEGPAAKLFVGNRCDFAVKVDYDAINATVRYSGGDTRNMRIYDPDYRLRPVTIDGRRNVWEAFEFEIDPTRNDRTDSSDDDAEPEPDSLGSPEQLCLDVSHIALDQPGANEQTICVEAL